MRRLTENQFVKVSSTFLSILTLRCFQWNSQTSYLLFSQKRFPVFWEQLQGHLLNHKHHSVLNSPYNNQLLRKSCLFLILQRLSCPLYAPLAQLRQRSKKFIFFIRDYLICPFFSWMELSISLSKSQNNTCIFWNNLRFLLFHNSLCINVFFL